jgi:hypothetical protein
LPAVGALAHRSLDLDAVDLLKPCLNHARRWATLAAALALRVATLLARPVVLNGPVLQRPERATKGAGQLDQYAHDGRRVMVAKLM